MARAGPDDNHRSRQLTLDDWVADLRASPQPKATPTARAVVSGRSQTCHASQSDSVAATTAHALLTTPEAACLLHVHPRTVQRLVERGHLEAVHLGAAVRFDPADVADLTARLKRHRAGATPTCADTVKSSRAVHISFADRLRSRQL
jgi:excisionase family DNA binding protein